MPDDRRNDARRPTSGKHPTRPGVVIIHGQDYLTVMPRLYAATPPEGEDLKPRRGIESVAISHEWNPPGTRLIVRATITFVDGSTFDGSAEARFLNARPNSPDATNPVECAETSAVGRALAMAGWPGSEDGFAGAEEMQTAMAIAASAHSNSAPFRKDPRGAAAAAQPTMAERELRPNALPNDEMLEAFEDVPTTEVLVPTIRPEPPINPDDPEPPMKMTDDQVNKIILAAVTNAEPPYPYRINGLGHPTVEQYYAYLCTVAAAAEVPYKRPPKNAINKWYIDNGGMLKAILIEKGALQAKPS